MSSLYQSLIAELAAIERQQQDLTLSPLDQQLLDQAWEDVTDRLDEFDTLADVHWRDAREYLEEEGNWNDSQMDTPPPPSPIRFAPSPPPILFGPGDHLPPPLSATRQEGYPPPAEPFIEPPPPPAPFYPDDREDCSRCPGCHYCTGYGYDGSDEV